MNKYYSEVVGRLVENFELMKVTKFISPNMIIRATRKSFRGGKRSKRDNIEMVVTIGRPNFVEREFIKKCKKVGEPFPVKKVQLKYFKGKEK